MKIRLTAAMIALLLSLILLLGCSAKPEYEYENPSNPLGVLQTCVLDDTTAGDTENGYTATKQLLLELGLDEFFVENLSKDRLADYASAMEINVLSYAATEEGKPSFWLTVCEMRGGELLISADAAWPSLPNEWYQDIFNVSSSADFWPDLESSFGWVSCGGEFAFFEKEDMLVFADGYTFSCGVRLDPEEIKLRFSDNNETAWRIHYEFDGRFALNTAINFNVEVNYIQAKTPYDGVTPIGYTQNRGISYQFSEKSKMSLTCYGMVTPSLLLYDPT